MNNQLISILIMSTYYILSAVLGLIAIVVLIRYFVQKRKSLPVELYLEALRTENSGQYRSAVNTYESALAEARKNKYNDEAFELKIREKLKVLQTMIDYENSFVKPINTVKSSTSPSWVK
jgi:hypothetical protein